MAKREREADKCYPVYPLVKRPRYSNEYPPLERDFYSLPGNDVRKHSYHLRPREHYHYYGRVPQHPAVTSYQHSTQGSERNAHSYSINGCRFSASSTASSRKRKLMTLKEGKLEVRRHHNAAASGDDHGHVSSY